MKIKKNERLIEKKTLFVSFAHIFWSNDDIFVKLWTTEGLSVFLQGKTSRIDWVWHYDGEKLLKKRKKLLWKKNTKSLRKETEQAKNKETKDNKKTTHLLLKKQQHTFLRPITY